MDEAIIGAAIDRIAQMELCFDRLLAADSAALREDPALGILWAQLCAYYEGGQWLQDYELDEQGLLPPDLKRGVLSQDAVYLFLERRE